MSSKEKIITKEVQRHRSLGRFWRPTVIVLTVLGLLLTINQIFLLKPIIDNGYLYGLIAIFLSLVFIVFPATKSSSRNKVPWYDVFLFVFTLSIAGYFAVKAWDIQHISYVFIAHWFINVAAFVLCVVALKAVRRADGITLFMFIDARPNSFDLNDVTV